MSWRVGRHTAGIVLFAGAVVWAVFTVMSREVAHVVGGAMELRFAHLVLDPGFRAAMDKLCEEYEAIQASQGRKVKVTPIEIPPNVYTQWARTQLLGRTAPEMMVISYELSRDAELVARYFRSFSEEIDLPNPYNTGTPHEGVPWRDTYVDGMRISGYIFSLADHHGIPISVSTHRVLANRRLLRAILEDPANAALAAEIGPSLVPRTFDQFIALCDAVKPWSERTGVPLFPIAANKDSGRIILDYSVGTQDQQLLLEWPVLKDAAVNETTLLSRLDRGETLWSDPAVRQGLEVLREIGLRVQPGFMQLRREDSNFAFATERALMIYVSSQDASSLRAMTDGRIDFVAFPIPFPTVGHSRYGRFAMGPLSEANVGGANPFGIVNYTSPAKQEQALDFLRFIASYRANETFTRVSNLLPALAGVETGPIAAPFALHLDGYPVGPPLHMRINDVRNLVDTYLYLVVSPQGGVDQFLAQAPSAMTTRALENIRTAVNGLVKTSARQDPLFASYYWLRTFAPAHRSDADRKLGILIDANDGNECDAAMRGPRLDSYIETHR